MFRLWQSRQIISKKRFAKTLVKIDQIEVLFPFEAPYECQVSMMESVIDCIRNGKHGLIESPTGTGKTLSILCAAIAAVQRSRLDYMIDEANKKVSAE